MKKMDVDGLADIFVVEGVAEEISYVIKNGHLTKEQLSGWLAEYLVEVLEDYDVTVVTDSD